jgi:23S rRNA pseudouridine1911/1915/1917 synthase
MKPYILDETEDFAVVFKPPHMHCAPLHTSEDGDTLVDWYAEIFPAVMELSGRKEGEGGLLHRLDYETQGLVLFAKNQQSLRYLLEQQEAGNFIKEYSAICQKADPHPSYHLPPFTVSSVQEGFVIESYFRPFGQGRKQVRPVIEIVRKGIAHDQGRYYRTEIVSVSKLEPDYVFGLRLRRGFRHQIRCHLAWIGCPILNDPLYGDKATNGLLALRANGLVFADPRSGELREYRMDALEIQSNPMYK